MTIKDGERREGIEIRLIHGATVSGRVLDAKGHPIDHATVEPRSASLRPKAGGAASMFLSVMMQNMSPDVREEVTDSEGRFKISNLLDGAYYLIVRHPDFGPIDGDPLTVPKSGEVAHPDIVLALGAKIRGRVLLQNGQPDTKAMVQISPVGTAPNLSGHRSAKTDADGRFEISGLAPGDYRVLVAQRNGQSDLRALFAGSASRPLNVVTLVAGEVKELDL